MPGRREETDEAVGPLEREQQRQQDRSVTLSRREDRWHWRRKIRANPAQLVFYRLAVGFAGAVFVGLGFVTGPIPGPGGIPLVLLGLAIWSSEFEWAHRLMLWFQAQLGRFRSWTRWQQTGFWVAFFACCGLFGYTVILLTGVPGWVPESADTLLDQLPGVTIGP